MKTRLRKPKPPIRKPVKDSGRDYQRRKERALALIREHELGVKLGQVVPIKSVIKERTELGRSLRDCVLAVPERVAYVIAAESDPKKVRRILRAELSQALETLANEGSADAE